MNRNRIASARHGWPALPALPALLALLALAALLPALARAEEAPRRRSTAEDSKEVAITVYNQDFGLVREVRTVHLPGTGRVALEFADVASRIQPETVHVGSLAGEGALRVLEQNYRYDLLNPQKLLEKYVGRTVKVYRWNEVEGRDVEYDAEVLSANQGTILKVGDEITYGFPGRISFPEIPDNLIAKPTLLWLLDSRKDRQDLEVSYVTQGLNWKADYVFVLAEDDTRGDITGWVTLTNQSGASFRDARLKLVAGDVQRVQERMARMQPRVAMEYAAAAPPQFEEEAFFEYHLYTLQRPTDLLQNEQKQVTLLEGTGIAVRKRLQFRGQSFWYRSSHGDLARNQKVGVFLEFENSKKNSLGIPLPKGIVRVYKADASGAQQFIGEDRIDHTPRDETIRIKMGEAFDVVGDRKQTNFRQLGRYTTETSWEIQLRNHKDEPVEVEVFEPVAGEWEIVASSHEAEKVDARTFTFRVDVPARGETTITWTVRISWK